MECPAPSAAAADDGMPIAFDRPRAVLLAVQSPNDTVLDSEGPALIGNMPGVVLRMSKIEFETEAITADTYRRAASNIEAAARRLRPQSEVTAVGLSCTSMSFTLGPEQIDAQFASALPKATTTDMARAQVAAVRALGVSRVGLLTPYIPEIAANNAAVLTAAGIEVVAQRHMGLTHSSMTDKVSKDTIRAWAGAVDCSAAQAIVIGCSAFRACEPGFIDELETALGKPVVTSTQAFLWSLCRAGGVEDRIGGYGKLMRSV